MIVYLKRDMNQAGMVNILRSSRNRNLNIIVSTMNKFQNKLQSKYIHFIHRNKWVLLSLFFENLTNVGEKRNVRFSTRRYLSNVTCKKNENWHFKFFVKDCIHLQNILLLILVVIKTLKIFTLLLYLHQSSYVMLIWFVIKVIANIRGEI